MPSSITTISGLLIEIARLLDGEDPTSSDISVATLTRLLAVAQARIYREVRTRYNEKAFSGVTVTSNAAAMPADFVEARVVHFGKYSLEPVPENLLRSLLDNGGTGDACYFAAVGSTLMFWPAVSDGTSVQGRYYARLADLTDANMASNALFQAADDLFIYATLVEAGVFFSRPADTVLAWGAKYAAVKDALRINDAAAAYSAGRMRVRPATALMR